MDIVKEGEKGIRNFGQRLCKKKNFGQRRRKECSEIDEDKWHLLNRVQLDEKIDQNLFPSYPSLM